MCECCSWVVLVLVLPRWKHGWRACAAVRLFAPSWFAWEAREPPAVEPTQPIPTRDGGTHKTRPVKSSVPAPAA